MTTRIQERNKRWINRRFDFSKQNIEIHLARYRETIAMRDPVDAVLSLERNPGDIPVVAELLFDKSRSIRLFAAKVLRMSGEQGTDISSAEHTIKAAIKQWNGESDSELRKAFSLASKRSISN